MTERYVLDSWAFMAYFQGEEPAAGRVRELLVLAAQGTTDIWLSIINLGEVYYSVGKRAGPPQAERALEGVRRLPVTIMPVTDDAVIAAARLKMHHPIAYADAFAAQLAHEMDAQLVTGDAELKRLQDYVQLEILHRK